MKEAEEHLKKAYGYLKEGKDFEAALRECDEAVSFDDSIADAHNLRGAVLERLGRAAEAVSAYEKALSIEPGFSEAKENLEGLKSAFKAHDNLVTVAVFSYLSETYAPVMKLRSEGVWSFTAGGEAANVMPHILPGMDGIKLKVKAEDAERAVEILGRELPEEDS